MKALSFTRPWTDLILSNVKDVENRVWRPWVEPPFPLIVHGALSWDPYARTLFDELVGEMPEDADRYCPRVKRDSPTGYLGIVTVTDAHPASSLACQPRPEYADWLYETCSPWAFDRQWHWHVTSARRFPAPIPGKGRLGMFDPPPEVVAAAMDLMPALP
jgi:hypothetical protein